MMPGAINIFTATGNERLEAERLLGTMTPRLRVSDEGNMHSFSSCFVFFRISCVPTKFRPGFYILRCVHSESRR